MKEGYLFSKNFYGFLVHPFLTVSRLKKEKDYSQGILFFGLPILAWFGWIFFLLVSRLVIQPAGGLKFGVLAKGSFLFATFFCALVVSYLLYWGYQVWRKEKNES